MVAAAAYWLRMAVVAALVIISVRLRRTPSSIQDPCHEVCYKMPPFSSVSYDCGLQRFRLTTKGSSSTLALTRCVLNVFGLLQEKSTVRHSATMPTTMTTTTYSNLIDGRWVPSV